MNLGVELKLAKCPHCSVDTPSIVQKAEFQTRAFDSEVEQFWKAYVCRRCGRAILAVAFSHNGEVLTIFPKPVVVDLSIPEPARTYLIQAIDSLHSPAGSV